MALFSLANLVCLLIVLKELIAQSTPPQQTITNCQTQSYDEVRKAQICSTCQISYFASSDKLSCLPCLPECASCSAIDNCSSCKNGNYLNQTRCSSCPSGCSTCLNSLNCTNCMPSHYMFMGNCNRCNIENCVKCTSGSNCDDCASGYWVSTSEIRLAKSSRSSGGRSEPTTYSCKSPLGLLFEVLLGFVALVGLYCFYVKCYLKRTLEKENQPDNIPSTELMPDRDGRPSIDYHYGQQPGQTQANYGYPSATPNFTMQQPMYVHHGPHQ